MFKNITLKIKLKTFWFITYLSVLFLPFIVCSYNYFQTYNIIKHEINNNNLVLLEQIQNVVDSIISDFNKISISLQLNDIVRSISYTEKPIDLYHHYRLYELKQDINSFKTANVSIEDIILNFKKVDVILNTRTTYPLDIVDSIDSETIRSKDWANINGMLTDTRYKLCGKPEFSSPFFTRSLLQLDKDNSLTNIVITFNEEFLIDKLRNNLPDNNANICIINDKNQVVMSTDSTLTEKMDFSNLKLSKPIVIKDNSGNNHVVSTIKSKVSEWRYLYIVPTSIYNKKLSNVSNLIFITLGICVILGLLIIYCYSRLNYRPVEKILSYIRQNNNEATLKSNEYNIILKNLKENYTEIVQLQQEQQNSIILKILNGEVNFSIINNATLNKLKLNFSSDRFIVAIIRITNPGTILVNDDIQTLTPNLSLLKFAISNVLKEFASGNYHCTFCEVESHVICLLNIDNKNMTMDENENKLKAKDLLYKIVTFFSEKYNAELACGISGEVIGADNLSFAYSEAKDACEYIQIFEEDTICCYRDIDNNAILDDNISDDSSNYIINIVLSGRVDELRECLNTKFNQVLGGKRSIFEVKYFMYYFYRTSLKLKSMLIQKYGIDYPKSIDNIQYIFSKPSLKKISSMIENIYISVCQFVAENKNKSTVNISDNICQYIDNNYIDTNLNVTTIASYFDFTPAYLSKKFKEDIGISIIDYIYKVRINTSKQMITRSNLKISDIATMVGFLDSNAFIRIFKKIEGVTPGAFKEMLL